MPFEFAFGRRPLATALVVGGFLALSAPAAHAQFFNFFFHNEGLDAGDVQNMLEDRGLTLVAPLHRNGGAYIADVEGQRGGRMRLIVDAQSGRIMQRFRVASPRSYGDYANPRPPADIGVSESNPFASSPPAVITFGQSIARGDDATSSPNVLAVPNEDGKLRPKPQVKPHKKIELTPVPQQPAQPAQNASSPAPEAKPPVHAEAVAPAIPETRAASPTTPAPSPAPAAAPRPAPAAPASSSKPKAINDVPVTPLD
jgi:hypothetical protein